MTMRFIPNTSIPSTDGALIYLFAFLDFMRTASPGGPGWTVPRSSNGTIGGAGDNIAAFGDLSQYVSGVSESWFVLRQPDGAREFLWERGNAVDAQWILSVSPSASFTGGDAGNPPTAVDQQQIHGLANVSSSGANVLHMGADDAAPYGFWTWLHLSGVFSNHQGGYGLIPITAAEDPAETEPWVFFFDGGGTGWVSASAMSAETGAVTVARSTAYQPGTSTYAQLSALSFNSQFGQQFPNSTEDDTDGADLSAPIAFGRRAALGSGFFKGITSFVEWNGVTRAPGETFDGLARISLGDVNVEWDGATTPLSS